MRIYGSFFPENLTEKPNNRIVVAGDYALLEMKNAIIGDLNVFGADMNGNQRIR